MIPLEKNSSRQKNSKKATYIHVTIDSIWFLSDFIEFYMILSVFKNYPEILRIQKS